MLFLRINGIHLYKFNCRGHFAYCLRTVSLILGGLHLQCRISTRIAVILTSHSAITKIMIKRSFLALLLLTFALSACTPKFDWREVRNSDVPLSVLMPAKPSSYTRDMQLDGIKVALQMTAADVDQLSFALAYAKLDHADAASLESNQEKLLNALKAGMLKNIHASQFEAGDARHPKNTLVATGQSANGQSIKMVARFFRHGSWVIQILVIGNEKAMSPEVLDMYFGSLKLE